MTKRIFGVDVVFTKSALFGAALFTWAFSEYGIGWGIFGAAVLYATILTHEFGHVLTARHYGIGCRRIYLHIVGGMAVIEGLGKRPGEQAAIAIGGPLTHIPMVALWTGLYLATGNPFMTHLAALNVLLFCFNLLPFGPLDGGRLLNAGIWKVGGNRAIAGMITSTIGIVFSLYCLVGLFLGLPVVSPILAVVLGILSGVELYHAVLMRRGDRDPDRVWRDWSMTPNVEAAPQTLPPMQYETLPPLATRGGPDTPRHVLPDLDAFPKSQ